MYDKTGSQTHIWLPKADVDRLRAEAYDLNERLADCKEELLRVCAEVAELRAEHTPRPMAEAPRDLTQILAYWRPMCKWVETYYDERYEGWILPNQNTCSDSGFTGWLPLPPAPTEDKP